MAISSLRDLDQALCVEGTCAVLHKDPEHYTHGWVGTLKEGLRCGLCGLEAHTMEEMRYMSREFSCIPQGDTAHAWRQSDEGKAFEKRRRFFDGNTFVGGTDPYEPIENLRRESPKVPNKSKHRR